MTRRCSIIAALVALVPASAAAQDTTAALLQRARSYYENLDLERALPMLRQVVSPQWTFPVTVAQRVDAYVYLGAALVLVGQRDSAVSYFAAALARDPFTDLDPQEFTPDQTAAFRAARPRVFTVGARPVARTRADVRTERVHFTVATTHAAALEVLLRPMEGAPDGGPSAPFRVFLGDNTGMRDVAWDGLTPDGHLVAPGRYQLLAVGRSSLAARTDSARVFFLVAYEGVTLEDTLLDLGRGALLPERAGAPGASRQLAKGALVAAAALLVSRAIVNRELGGGQRGGADVVAGVALVAGAAGFLTLGRRHELPENIQANLQRQAERRAANQAIQQRNAARVAQAVLIITPAAGVGP